MGQRFFVIIMFMDPSLGADFANLYYRSVSTFLSMYPFWLPLFCGYVFVHTWFHYIRSEFVEKQGGTLLEIRLPKEVTKSPLAMEIFLASIWQKGSASWIDTYINGKIRNWFSLEIASIGGKVHFYIWTHTKFKDLIEAQLYAYYPGIVIEEVKDYTDQVFTDPEEMPMWGTYYKHTKKSKTGGSQDMYQIKSYVDFGLDKASEKEEFKIDPMNSVLEWMGSLQAGEQAWFQILIQAHKKLGLQEGHLKKVDDWLKSCETEIANIKKAATPESDSEFPGFPNLTKGQAEAIAAIERNAHKLPFDTCIRGMYIATKAANKLPVRVPGLIGAFRQYGGNYNYLNNLGLGFYTDFEYPWQDFGRIRRTSYEKKFLDAFKHRSFFTYPYKHWNGKPFIMTTESLATIFHLPGATATTPSLDRIESRRSEAPSNLPI